MEPEVQRRVHKSPPFVSLKCYITSVYVLPSCLRQTYFNIVFHCTHRFSVWSHFFRFPHQNPVPSFFSPVRATCPTNLIVHLITRVIFWWALRSVKTVHRRTRVSDVPLQHSASIIKRRDPAKCLSVTNDRNPQVHQCGHRTRQTVCRQRIIEARTDGRTGRYDEVNNRLSKFCIRAYYVKIKVPKLCSFLQSPS